MERFKVFNPITAYKNQIKYCSDNNLRLKIPLDAVCSNCAGKIFSTGGYSIKEASNSYLIECPYCKQPF